MPNVTHVIFDMDGLLLDTECFYTQVQQKILQRYGKEFTWELKAKMMGKKALEAAETLVTELGLEGQLSPEDFVKEREEMLDTMFPNSELMPGVKQLVQHLRNNDVRSYSPLAKKIVLVECNLERPEKKSGLRVKDSGVQMQVPMCVATSSHKRNFELKTQNHKEFFQNFDHIVTGDEVKNGKPDPEIFLLASSLWASSPQPEQCLVFEDAPSGVAAAKAAGMNCIMVPDPNLSEEGKRNADVVIKSLCDVNLEQFSLPVINNHQY